MFVNSEHSLIDRILDDPRRVQADLPEVEKNFDEAWNEF